MNGDQTAKWHQNSTEFYCNNPVDSNPMDAQVSDEKRALDQA